MNRTQILEEANRIVTKDRAATHGNPENSFQNIADLWSAYLGIEITPITACHLMALMKIARAKGNPNHLDSYIDAVGYECIAGELATKPTEHQQSASDASQFNLNINTPELIWKASNQFNQISDHKGPVKTDRLSKRSKEDNTSFYSDETVREALQRCATMDDGWASSALLDAEKCEKNDHPAIRDRAVELRSRAENYKLAAARYRSALDWISSQKK